MVEPGEKNQGSSHEGGKIDGKKESRPKPGPRAGSSGGKHSVSDPWKHVENGDSTLPSADPIAAPEPERPGTLTRLQVAAVQRAYQAGISRETIAKTFGLGLSTTYKYTRGLEVTLPPDVLSQPTPSPVIQPAPPTIVDLPEEKGEPPSEEARQPQSEPNEYTPSSQRQTRPALPVLDNETISRIVMLFGEDVLRKQFTDFVDYFRDYLIPKVRLLEYWLAWIPGKEDAEKTKNFQRYLLAARRYFQQGEAYKQFENDGAKEEDNDHV